MGHSSYGVEGKDGVVRYKPALNIQGLTTPYLVCVRPCLWTGTGGVSEKQVGRVSPMIHITGVTCTVRVGCVTRVIHHCYMTVYTERYTGL